MNQPIRARVKRTSQCVITGLPTDKYNSLVVASSCEPSRLPAGNYHYTLFSHLDQHIPPLASQEDLKQTVDDLEEQAETDGKAFGLQQEQTHYAHELIESMFASIHQLHSDGKIRKMDREMFDMLLENSYVEL